MLKVNLIYLIPVIVIVLLFSILFYDENPILKFVAYIVCFIVISMICLVTSPFTGSAVLIGDKYVFYSKNPFKTLYVFINAKWFKKLNTRLVVSTDSFLGHILEDIKNNTCDLKVIK